MRDGELLAGLAATRAVKGYGVEIDPGRVLAAVGHGVNVIQMDLESGLSVFEDDAFDFVILSQTLQAMRRSDLILKEMLRVGTRGSSPSPTSATGSTPVDPDGAHAGVGIAPYQWYDTPNIHLCTVKDFEGLCDTVGAEILDERVLHEGEIVGTLPNLLGAWASSASEGGLAWQPRAFGSSSSCPGWTVYVIYLPQLAAQAGLPKEYVPWLLLLDQAIFAAMDWTLGTMADRMAGLADRLANAILFASLLSCGAFLLLPLVAPAGSPALLVAVTVVWSATSSALRAPPLALIGRHVPGPSQPWASGSSCWGWASRARCRLPRVALKGPTRACPSRSRPWRWRRPRS